MIKNLKEQRRTFLQGVLVGGACVALAVVMFIGLNYGGSATVQVDSSHDGVSSGSIYANSSYSNSSDSDPNEDSTTWVNKETGEKLYCGGNTFPRLEYVADPIPRGHDVPHLDP